MATVPNDAAKRRRALLAPADDIAPAQRVTGVNSLSARNIVGRKTSAGAPTTSTWLVDDEVVDSLGVRWRCTVAGTPGTWVTVDESYPTSRDIAAGLSVLDRDVAVGNVAAVSSGQMILGYVQAKRAEALSQVVITTGTTLAAATPTLIRVGVWSLIAGVSLQVAATDNDTTLLAAANTDYAKAFAAPFTPTPGVWYAVGILVVSAAAMPSFLGVTTPASNAPQTAWARTPRLTGIISSLSDLPSTITSGLGNTTRRIQAVLLP